MAKVSFTKLNKIKNIDPITCEVNGENVIIQQYLPIDKKLNLIANVIEAAGETEQGFYNVIKLEVFFVIEMIQNYTNINITDKVLEDPSKAYDIIHLNGIWDVIKTHIPKNEYEYIWNNLLEMAKEVTKYNQSALGILKIVSNDYNNAEFNASSIVDELKDAEGLEVVKQVLEKLN